MRCIKCGKAIQDGSVFCNWCGEKQHESDRTAPTSERHPKTHGNGLGTVFKDGKTWTAEYTVAWVDSDNSGSGKLLRKRKKKRGFKTKKDGLAYLESVRLGSSTGNKPDSEENNAKVTKITSTVGELYEDYSSSEMEKLSESKRTAYGVAWRKRIRPILVDRHIDDVTIKDLNDIVRPLTYYPAKDVRDLMSLLFQRAIAERQITTNVARYVTMPDNDSEREVVPWESGEIEKLWKAYATGNRIAALSLLMIYSGMMTGELFKLETRMINWEEKTIVGCGLKTKKRKELPIVFPDMITPVLQYLVETSVSRKGRVLGMGDADFYNGFKEMKSELGIREEVTPYSGRHSTANQLALANVHPGIITQVMRQATYKTTVKHYNDFSTDVKRDALNSISISDDA